MIADGGLRDCGLVIAGLQSADCGLGDGAPTAGGLGQSTISNPQYPILNPHSAIQLSTIRNPAIHNQRSSISILQSSME
jgi:hypothetical protein